jgi:hypothetical protein
MIGLHTHAGPARHDHRRRTIRRVGRHRAQLGRLAADDVDQHMAPRRAGAHADEQGRIGLVVHLDVAARVAAAGMAPDGAAVQRDRILAHVEQGAAVGRPGDALEHAADALGLQATGLQMLDVEVEGAAAEDVLGPRQPLARGSRG